MIFLKNYFGPLYRYIKNQFFYYKNRRFIHSFFKDNEYYKVKPFNIAKWHHDLFLFSAVDSMNSPIFIKLTSLPRVLKNERKAYLSIKKNPFLEKHLIEFKGYIKKGKYKALILKKSDGVVLNEYWAIKNIEKLGSLINIVNEFVKNSIVHRDLKLDNFIYENGEIKVFDFSFMIDLSKKTKLKEIDLTQKENLLKLEIMGEGYKPEIFVWDDFYSLSIIFDKLLSGNLDEIPAQKINLLNEFKIECQRKIGTLRYEIPIEELVI